MSRGECDREGRGGKALTKDRTLIIMKNSVKMRILEYEGIP